MSVTAASDELYEARERTSKLKVLRDKLREALRISNPELMDQLDNIEKLITEANKEESAAKEKFIAAVDLALDKTNPFGHVVSPYVKVIRDEKVVVRDIQAAVPWLLDVGLGDVIQFKFTIGDRETIRNFGKRGRLPADSLDQYTALYVDEDAYKITVHSHDRWAKQ